MIKTYHLILLILIANTIFAVKQAFSQEKSSKITGVVTDNQQKPIDYANIALLYVKDSSLVKMAFSNEQGKYTLEKIPAGNYLILASVMNHSKVYSPVFEVQNSTSVVNLKPIILVQENKVLTEVKISSKKPLIERKMDKTIVNVESSSILAGSNALDILEKSPGVTVSNDDVISMSGKQGVLILINGKQTYLSEADVAGMLRNMQSNEIETIELISSPSAKYDASGTAGIINIKTKKDKRAGGNGTLTLGTGYGSTSKYNAGTNLNYRKDKFNIFGNYNFSDLGADGYLLLNRNVLNEGKTTIFRQNAKSHDRRSAQSYRSGIDYSLNKNHTIGIQINGYQNKSNSPDNTSFTNISATSASAPPESGFTEVHAVKNAKFRNIGYNLNYTGKLDTMGTELSIDADYSKYKGNDLDKRSVDTSYQNLRGIYFVKNNTLSNVDLKTIKADYIHPFNKSTKMEAGIKSSFVKTDNNLEYLKSINDENHYEILPAYTNRFTYNENINAAYFNLSRQYKKIGIQIGLRAEQTHTTTELARLQKKDYDYIDFFPSAALSYKVNEKNDLGLSYSRRIDRPGYDDLNPTLREIDNKTFTKGNEFLRPQYSNSVELAHTYSFLTTSLSYTNTTDAMLQIAGQDNQTGVTYQMMKNLNSEKIYSLNIFGSKNIFKWWQLNSNLNIFHSNYKYTYDNNDYNGGQTSANYYLNNAMTIFKDLIIETSFYYQSSLTRGIDKIKSFNFVDAGIRKSFLSNNLNIKLSISDIFNTRIIHGSTNYQNIDLNFTGKRESRIGRLNLTYRFGNSAIKAQRQRKSATQEESGRMKQ